MSKIQFTHKSRLVYLLLASATLLGCSGNNDDEPANNDIEVISQQSVSAMTGGSFSGAENNITINIPAGVLSADATLSVTQLPSKPASRGETTSVSSSYNIALVDANGDEISSSENIKLIFNSSTSPTHPQLGEIVRQSDSEWEGLKASFYRADSQQIVTMTRNINGTFRAQLRTLQAVTGDSVAAGKTVFMTETFGNEAFFGAVMGLHEVLNGVKPTDAVALGVQIDIDKVPAAIVAALTNDDDLDFKDSALADPATTRALIKAGAVIGVKGVFGDTDNPDIMTSAGLTCALCHVTVTPSKFLLNDSEGGSALVALPIGKPRIDGVPNTNMNSGAILAFTPFAVGDGTDTTTVDFLNSWGPGRFDVRSLPDNPLEDGIANPTAYPPIWNFVDLEEQGYSIGWDGLFKSSLANNGLASISEAVYDLVMHANGAFGTATGTIAPELRETPPLALLNILATAEAEAEGNDITEQKLLDIQDFMRSITSPAPGSFNQADAEQGFELFYGEANCSSCHSTADLSGPGFYSITANSPAGALAAGIHTPGLRGISWTAPYFHDGSAATLTDTIDQLIAKADVTDVQVLTVTQKMYLVEYLKSL